MPSFSNTVIGAIIFLNEFKENQQVETINLIRESLLSKNDSVRCMLLFVDLSCGNIFYPKSNKLFLLHNSQYVKRIIKTSKAISMGEMSTYKDFHVR